MNSADIQNAIAAAAESWYVLGLRYDSRELELGEDVGDSYRWDDGEDTGEQLNGTCAIDASRNDALDLISDYKEFGTLYLIGSQTHYDSGEDKGEIVITNAVVIARF
jgi:hypothetical protein